MPLIVDASVAIKWVIDEPDSALALSVCQGDLIAPDLLLPECANVLWKIGQRGQLTSAIVLQKLDIVLSRPITLVSSSSLARRALEIALELGHPAYDAFYLAAAEVYQTRLVTTDTRLLRRVATSSLSHLAIGLDEAAAN